MHRLSRSFMLVGVLVAVIGCGPGSPQTAGHSTGYGSGSSTTTGIPAGSHSALASSESPTGQPTVRLVARPALRIELEETAGATPLRVVLRGLDPSGLNLCRKVLPAHGPHDAFAVYVHGGSADLPPLLGDCRVDGDLVVFEPRYPPRPGIGLRAVWDPEKIPCGGPGKVEVVFERKAPPVTPTARLIAIYPTRDVLPENQLKFYLHFSKPMSRGEAYAKVRLLDEQGQAVDRPFLELGEELWDPTGTRFTLYFDPGRIKRGLQPRELFGPSLIEGHRYQLVVDETWRDADGAPLVESGVKSFSVAAPDETQPDPKRWSLLAPTAATREPLTVELGEPLDRALLERVLIVQTSDAVVVDGKVTVDAEETRWQFTPTQAWNAGGYRLVVETILEDLAGNSIGQPFEVNMLAEKQRPAAPESIALSFDVPPAQPATP